MLNEIIQTWNIIISTILDKPDDIHEIIKFYDKHMNIKDIITSNNNYPIRKACELGCYSLVQYLLENNADPTVDHNIALRCAVYNGHEDVVKLLLHDNRVDACDDREVDYCPSVGVMSALDISEILLPTMTNYLENSIRGKILTFDEFCELNDYKLLQEITPIETNKKIVLQNAKILTINDKANHMLYYIAKNNLSNTELIQVFKSAVENGSNKCVNYLIHDFEVDPSFENNWALRNAAQYGQHKIVESLLCDDRVDKNVNNNEALNLAIHNGHTKVIELLEDN
jgi:ankyrin repeat protein